jgi:Transposase DDE domain group 1
MVTPCRARAVELAREDTCVPSHACVENRIRCAKDTGLRNLPFADFSNNACWVELVCMAQYLFSFAQGLVLVGDLATAEPKRLRYALSHIAGRLTSTSRTTTTRLQRELPWADESGHLISRRASCHVISLAKPTAFATSRPPNCPLDSILGLNETSGLRSRHDHQHSNPFNRPRHRG